MKAEEFDAYRREVANMDDIQKRAYYEMKMKNMTVGMLLAIFLCGGAGLIYVGSVGAGIACILLSWLIVPYVYAIWATYKGIEEYNNALYQATFASA